MQNKKDAKPTKKAITIRPESDKTRTKDIYKKNGRLKDEFYLKELEKLQVELLKLQD